MVTDSLRPNLQELADIHLKDTNPQETTTELSLEDSITYFSLSSFYFPFTIPIHRKWLETIGACVAMVGELMMRAFGLAGRKHNIHGLRIPTVGFVFCFFRSTIGD